MVRYTVKKVRLKNKSRVGYFWYVYDKKTRKKGYYRLKKGKEAAKRLFYQRLLKREETVREGIKKKPKIWEAAEREEKKQEKRAEKRKEKAAKKAEKLARKAEKEPIVETEARKVGREEIEIELLGRTPGAIKETISDWLIKKGIELDKEHLGEQLEKVSHRFDVRLSWVTSEGMEIGFMEFVGRTPMEIKGRLTELGVTTDFLITSTVWNDLAKQFGPSSQKKTSTGDLKLARVEAQVTFTGAI